MPSRTGPRVSGVCSVGPLRFAPSSYSGREVYVISTADVAWLPLRAFICAFVATGRKSHGPLSGGSMSGSRDADLAQTGCTGTRCFRLKLYGSAFCYRSPLVLVRRGARHGHGHPRIGIFRTRHVASWELLQYRRSMKGVCRDETCYSVPRLLGRLAAPPTLALALLLLLFLFLFLSVSPALFGIFSSGSPSPGK